MRSLRDKTILLISPQSWGNMFLSKHHYAIELAKRGNRVYFLNPPAEKNEQFPEKIQIEASTLQKNLFLIRHRLNFPYNIKFHFIRLFHMLMKPHIKKILKKIESPVDIIWSFDLGNLYPFNFFPDNCLKIFHPVDEPLNETAIHSAKGAQMIFSVTHEILEKYKQFNIPRHFINHGVAEEFLINVNKNHEEENHIHVGLSGNLLRTDIDREIMLQIIRENPQMIFDCWGSYSLSQSNIGGGEDENTKSFISNLQAQPNVSLHGVVSGPELAKAIHRADAFLICYDVNKDQSRGTNYHKVMEYLSTGKVIVSNNITTYRDCKELIQMVDERDNNRNLPGLFKKVLSELNYFNNASLQEKRIRFAQDSSYQRQVDRIEKIIYD